MKIPLRSYALRTALLIAAAAFTVPSGARTLEQIKQLGAISLCANPEALPYSADDPNMPGFQVEIGQAIAQRLGVQLKVDWLVPRRRVREVNCDMLLDNPSDPKMYEDRRLLSIPYAKSGVALALRADAPDVKVPEDLKKQRKIGVMVSSLASVVLGKKELPTSPFAFQTDMLDALVRGELSAAAVSAPTLSYYLVQHPENGVRAAELYTIEPQLGWNVSVGLRNADQALLDQVNRAVTDLLRDGTIAKIYSRYGIRHQAPSL
ncbi:MAG TPA: transporter substrate-binding domain-containing protein [Burkholderiales bacterium]|nr:transporter substrate-binding domain-containing protein [Burkholderiales bacterium]